MAEETKTVETTEEENQKQTEHTEEQTSLPQSQSELDSFVGRAIEKALKNNDKKWEGKVADEIKKTQKQAETYAKMTADQRKEADLSAREQKIQAREQELNHQQLLNDVTADLTDKGLPTVFAESLANLGDNEAISKAVTEIKSAWDDSIAQQLKASARQNTPQTSASPIDPNDKIDLQKMAQDVRLIKN